MNPELRDFSRRKREEERKERGKKRKFELEQISFNSIPIP